MISNTAELKLVNFDLLAFCTKIHNELYLQGEEDLDATEVEEVGEDVDDYVEEIEAEAGICKGI